MQVSADRYTAEYFAEPAPDGRTLAFTARAMAGSQWWRKGHSHLGDTYGDSGNIVWGDFSRFCSAHMKNFGAMPAL